MAAPTSAGGQKRPMPPAGGPPAKRAEEGWVCKECGNHNYEGRAYCNLRKCGAPGPWTCPGCGNRNFANRDVCNMRNCNMPRPAPPPGTGPLATAGVQGMPQQMQVGGQQQAVLQALSLLQAAGVAHIPGVQDGISKIVQSTGMAVPAAPIYVMQQQSRPVIGAIGQPPIPAAKSMEEGSWVCLACGNVNFPGRTSCNARSCGRPRSEVDGGAPTASGRADRSSKSGISMPGSWVCAACDNINWPQRESCGMKKCGRPRSEVDAGPPTPQHLQQKQASVAPIPAAQAAQGGRSAPEGSWTCSVCNNLNYPNREVCNARNCGQPRF